MSALGLGLGLPFISLQSAVAGGGGGGEVAFVQSASDLAGASPSAITVPLGQTATAGNLLIAASRFQANVGANPIAAPEGFTLVSDFSSPGVQRNLIWFKVAEGNETEVSVGAGVNFSKSLHVEEWSLQGAVVDVAAVADTDISVTSDSITLAGTAAGSVVFVLTTLSNANTGFSYDSGVTLRESTDFTYTGSALNEAGGNITATSSWDQSLIINAAIVSFIGA